MTHAARSTAWPAENATLRLYLHQVRLFMCSKVGGGMHFQISEKCITLLSYTWKVHHVLVSCRVVTSCFMFNVYLPPSYHCSHAEKGRKTRSSSCWEERKDYTYLLQRRAEKATIVMGTDSMAVCSEGQWLPAWPFYHASSTKRVL